MSMQRKTTNTSERRQQITVEDLAIIISIVVTHSVICPYDCSNGYNKGEEDCAKNQGSGPDVEGASSRAIVLGAIQISEHLPVSGL